ncbi:hypothetical protein E0Z10_g1401 [Xylaria hypoxylon]|uniref:Uncharacterized protein n=1 Tax=Xylaria hypoxylon TaxID=37992 RepID=A0A4Z0Z5B7_9PEZI|nr:hypothetical protein E0Z10_g1401 [Xylaria hypoxylon]
MSASENETQDENLWYCSPEEKARQSRLYDQAEDKLKEIRPKVKLYAGGSKSFEFFLLQLFEVIFDLASSCPKDIHVLLKDDSPHHNEPRFEIWINENHPRKSVSYDPRKTVSYDPRKSVSYNAFRVMKDYATKMADLGGTPRFLHMVNTLYSGDAPEIFDKIIEQHSSSFNVSDFLAGFPNRTLDCGWFRSMEQEEGTPVDPNLITAYEDFMKKKYLSTGDNGRIIWRDHKC